MRKEQVNPWTWQDRLGFSQAWKVEGPQTVLYLAGQGPIGADGTVVAEGDFEAQVRHTFENLKTVLAASRATLALPGMMIEIEATAVL